MSDCYSHKVQRINHLLDRDLFAFWMRQNRNLTAIQDHNRMCPLGQYLNEHLEERDTAYIHYADVELIPDGDGACAVSVPLPPWAQKFVTKFDSMNKSTFRKWFGLLDTNEFKISEIINETRMYD